MLPASQQVAELGRMVRAFFHRAMTPLNFQFSIILRQGSLFSGKPEKGNLKIALDSQDILEGE